MAEKKQFTSFEILLGVGVIAAIALVGLPLLTGGSGVSGDQRAVVDAETIARAVLDYRNGTGSWPESDQGLLNLGCLTGPMAGAGGVGKQVQATNNPGTALLGGGDAILRPWLEEVPLDPWYRPYHVWLLDGDGAVAPAVAPAAGYPYTVVVVSAGADGSLQSDLIHLRGGVFGGDDLGFVLPPAATGAMR